MTTAELDTFQSGLKSLAKGVSKASPMIGFGLKALGWTIDIVGWNEARKTRARTGGVYGGGEGGTGAGSGAMGGVGADRDAGPTGRSSSSAGTSGPF